MDQLTPSGHALGRKPDLSDIRDVRFSAPSPRAPLPVYVDLRDGIPPIGDQGNLGSCTAWATLAAYRWQLRQQGGLALDFDGSELAQYYWTRLIEHTTHEDAGASIRDSIKAVVQHGMAPETDWPYDVSKFAHAPSARARKDAALHQALQYESVPVDLYAIKRAVAAKLPVIIGVSVYSSFESDRVATTGSVPVPSPDESLLGGHAMLICGYIDSMQCAIVRNQWGDFGEHGYLYMPYAYVANPQLGEDYWVIRRVEG
jgi:C1A family cysteine protease